MSPPRLRVLLAESTRTQADALLALLAAQRDIEVLGLAVSYDQLVEQLPRLRPDVLALDLRLQGGGGLVAAERIMREHPTPIVLCAAPGDPQAGDVDAALRSGALAMARKLELPAADPAQQSQQGEDFLRALRAMAGMRLVRRRDPRATEAGARAGSGHIRLLAIAASTGGPNALARVLGALPPELPLPVVVVQHMARGFLPGLVRWLSTQTRLAVQLARDGEGLKAGTVYLAPDDLHLSIDASLACQLRRDPPENGFRPSADVLFRSIARHWGASALALVLTGMGRDGAEGLKALRACGAEVFAQDEASCAVFGMPQAAIAADAVSRVVKLDDLPAQLMARIGTGNPFARTGAPNGHDSDR